MTDIEKKVKALKMLIDKPKIRFNDTDIIWLDDRSMPTDKDILSKMNEIDVLLIKDSLNILCDTKSVEAKAYINGAKVTAEQLARYEEKYQIALEYKSNGNYATTLQLEADLQGLTVDELADLIIAKGQAYKQALISFNAKIEAFRVQVSKLIADGNLVKANKVITKAKELGAGATDEDIKGLFA